MDLFEALAESQISRDEAEGRVYGWLPGVVTDVDTQLKRVKARIGAQGDQDSSDWLVQMCPGSVESLPEVGDPVGVLFHDGDVHRGAYFYFPQSTTNGRPMQPIPLGLALVGLFNFLVDQVNQLRTDFNTLAGQTAGHTHPGVTTGLGTTGAAAITQSSTSALAANKGKAADGSLVSNQTSSVVVLSKRSLVR